MVFELWRLRSWAGDMRRLRLSWSGTPSVQTEVTGARVEKRGLGDRQLDAVLSSPWDVELGGSRRPARVALPGRPIEIDHSVAAGGVMKVGFGFQAGPRQSILFRVLDREAGVSVFEHRLEPLDDLESSGWHEAEVNLRSPEAVGGSLDGALVTLSFVVETEAPLDPARGLPIWGEPIFVREPQ